METRRNNKSNQRKQINTIVFITTQLAKMGISIYSLRVSSASHSPDSSKKRTNPLLSHRMSPASVSGPWFDVRGTRPHNLNDSSHDSSQTPSSTRQLFTQLPTSAPFLSSFFHLTLLDWGCSPGSWWTSGDELLLQLVSGSVDPLS